VISKSRPSGAVKLPLGAPAIGSVVVVSTAPGSVLEVRSTAVPATDAFSELEEQPRSAAHAISAANARVTCRVGISKFLMPSCLVHSSGTDAHRREVPPAALSEFASPERAEGGIPTSMQTRDAALANECDRSAGEV
jgi:hypothetical protein